ncbi:putative pentatricopeptide repeat-containing protein [Tanacetum coccineum]
MDIPHIRLLQHSARPHPLRLNAHPTQLNQRTLAIVLKTCDFLSSLTSGLQVHALAIKVSLATEPFTASGLKDAVCFSSVIVHLDQNSKPVDALSYFAEMRASGFLSTDYCVSGALRASSELETLEQCCSCTFGWNALMSNYAQQGDKDSVVELFSLMEYRGLAPDGYTFLSIMTAFCNAGRLEEAKNIALTMPNYKPDAAMWRALLSTSAHHGNIELVKEMSQRLQELDPQDDSAYVIAANAFSGSAGDRRHEDTEKIYAKLSELQEKILKLGYVPVYDQMMHEVGRGEKMEALWYHSEKLALAFGLVVGAAPPGKALRIVKNLRICRDCHEAFKYISRVVDREIIVRDVNRYHSDTHIVGCFQDFKPLEAIPSDIAAQPVKPDICEIF